MASDKETVNQQFKNAYVFGMGFLMKHFLKVTSDESKYNKLDSFVHKGKNYFIESNSVDTLMQIASFVVHKNVYYIGDSGYPNFKGFSFKHYKNLMDDMMANSEEYHVAKNNDILIMYFPREVASLDKVVPCLAPIVSSRDNDNYINIVLTTNSNLYGYFKNNVMSSDRDLIYKKMDLPSGGGSQSLSNSNKSNTTGEVF